MNRRRPMTDADWAAIRETQASWTPAEAKQFLRKIMGSPRRTLTGQEREHVMTMLALLEPFEESNNQNSWTSCYRRGDIEYQVTTFFDSEEIVDQMLPEDDE